MPFVVISSIIRNRYLKVPDNHTAANFWSKIHVFLPCGGWYSIPCLFRVWTLPGVCPTSHRQWADFLVSLMALLHRQYKTARTETRWHLQLKIRQMPIQTSALRGYVLFSSAIRDTHKSPKIVCWFADTVRGVSKLGKTRIIMNASLRMVRNTGFCVRICRRMVIRNFLFSVLPAILLIP